ncbi:MAG: DUF6291 domain-containing protein [Oscillospiraceae bacterium]|nr:DUF6291 domain-containing protein [Oscillospiraceae bacterium]
MTRKSFSIHSDFYSELRNLSPESRGAVLLALLNWAEGLDTLPLAPEGAILFRLMTAQMERLSSANSANGKRGGAPDGNRNAAKSSETSEGEKNEPIKPSDSVSTAATVTVFTGSIGRSASAEPPKRTKFTPPSVDEVAEYCAERKSLIDAAQFCDYYASQGWRVGKNPMSDWRAAVRNWGRGNHSGLARASPEPQIPQRVGDAFGRNRRALQQARLDDAGNL